MNYKEPSWRKPEKKLVFSPMAWLKLMYFLHNGNTEIGGFGISSPDNPLYIDEFVTMPQTTSAVTVEFEQTAIADFFDDCVDKGLKPAQFARIWCHTHPGESPEPSGTDESTFSQVFGVCDWAVMFIVGITGKTYARLSFSAGPGVSVLLPVAVDWAEWPQAAFIESLDEITNQWYFEFEKNINPRKAMFTAEDIKALDLDESDFQRFAANGDADDWDGWDSWNGFPTSKSSNKSQPAAEAPQDGDNGWWNEKSADKKNKTQAKEPA